MFQQFVSKHNSPQNSILTTRTVVPAVNCPVLSTPPLARVTAMVNLSITAAVATPGGFAQVVVIDDFSLADNQVISVSASLTSTVGNLIPILVRFESVTVPTSISMGGLTHYPLEFISNGNSLSVKDCVTVSTNKRSTAANNRVYVGVILVSNAFAVGNVYGTISVNQVDTEVTVLQPLK